MAYGAAIERYNERVLVEGLEFRLPAVDEQLKSPFLHVPLYESSLVRGDLDHADLLARVYNTHYGESLARNPPRFSLASYEPTWLMLWEYGAGADPVGHNFMAFRYGHNLLKLEETRGNREYSPVMKDLLLFSWGLHDAVEGVVSDVPRGQKTPEFRAFENRERRKMIMSCYDGVLPDWFLYATDDVIGHRYRDSSDPTLRLLDETSELVHEMIEFRTGLRLADAAFTLFENGYEFTPFGGVVGTQDRFEKILTMSAAIVTSTVPHLQHYAERGFWSAQDMLASDAEQINMINDHLVPLALGRAALN